MRLISPLPILLAALGCNADLGESPEVFDESTPPSACAGKCDGATEVATFGALPEATVATLFAPYDPTIGLELALIRAVTTARAADPGAYAEGENPFTIRYAVYNLRNPLVVAALADAADAGVDVQILIDEEQLDPERTWNTTDEELVARGFELVVDHRTLDDRGRREADLIGIATSGLMHLKARLYRWVDPATGAIERRLLTGSMNPGDEAVHNDETLHYVTIPAIVDRYEAKYAAVLERRKVTNAWDEGAAVNVLFSPDLGTQAVDRIAQLIDAEDELILLAVFSLRNIKPTSGGKGILERLVAAHQRGVKVVVVTDRKQSDGVDVDGNPIYSNDPSEEILRAAGVQVHEVLNRSTPYTAMHSKYAVFGLTRPIVVTDAGNWSRVSLGSGTSRPQNDESVLFIDAVALDAGVTARRYLGNYLELLRKYGQGGAAAELTALPGWPTAELTFTARVETSWGEGVFVTGDLDVLGRWTQAGAGWPLVTDSKRYPQWTSATLVLPLGTAFEYKLVATSGGAVRWESGANRTLVADPTDRRVTGADAASGTILADLVWRP